MIAAGNFPTWDQFKADPEKWRKRLRGGGEENLELVDVLPEELKRRVKKVRYYVVLAYPAIRTKRLLRPDSLEAAQQAMIENGFKPDAFDIRPQLVDVDEGKFDIHVFYYPKGVPGDGAEFLRS